MDEYVIQEAGNVNANAIREVVGVDVNVNRQVESGNGNAN